MSVLIDENTRLIVQGITGREGSFHTRQMLDYGTNVVAGVTPGKGGTTVEGVPVYNTVHEAMRRHDANASVLFVPPKFTYGGAQEAIVSGVPLVITIAEGVPVYDMYQLYHLAHAHGSRLIGPNSFGIISPGKSKAGFMAHRIFSPGNVSILSRSATNAYETVFRLTNNGIGQSTVIGVGGDMIAGSSFTDLLPLLEADPDTKVIVIIGEIGGGEEELAAAYIKENVSKPVVAFIAGKNAPKDRSMGHAGAIVSPDGEGSAENKEAAMKDAGAVIADSTVHITQLVADILK